MILFVDFFYVLPELFLFVAVVLLLAQSLYYSTNSAVGYPILATNVAQTSSYIIALTILLCYTQPAVGMLIFLEACMISEYAQLLRIIVLVFGFCILYVSIQYIGVTKLNPFEYQILMLLGLLGTLVVLLADSIGLLYVAIELQTLCFYILTTARRLTEASSEAGLKYFIFGAFSSGLLLFGLSLIYAGTGVSTLSNLVLLFLGLVSTTLLSKGTLYLGLVLFAVGILFKLYAAPFHIWVPDIYQGAPTNIALFFAVIPGFVFGAFIFKFVGMVTANFADMWTQLFSAVAALSLFVGCLCAIYQKSIMRVIAYSSTMNVGFILFGVLASETAGYTAVFLYQLVYAIATVLLFSVLLGSFITIGTSPLLYLRDFICFAKEQLPLAIALSISVFSMAGFPPIAGFFTKLFLCLCVSAVSAFYYLRFVHIAYFVHSFVFRTFKPVFTESAYATSTGMLILLFFVIEPDFLLLLSSKLSIVMFL
jgi:NADH-quinone oxidoreductase subunit N